MKGQNAICVCGSLAFFVKLRGGAGQHSWGAVSGVEVPIDNILELE